MRGRYLSCSSNWMKSGAVSGPLGTDAPQQLGSARSRQPAAVSGARHSSLPSARSAGARHARSAARPSTRPDRRPVPLRPAAADVRPALERRRTSVRIAAATCSSGAADGGRRIVLVAPRDARTSAPAPRRRVPRPTPRRALRAASSSAAEAASGSVPRVDDEREAVLAQPALLVGLAPARIAAAAATRAARASRPPRRRPRPSSAASDGSTTTLPRSRRASATARSSNSVRRRAGRSGATRA